MKCYICGKSPAQGYNLYRQNPKGQPGVFACFACATHSKPVDDELVRVVAAIQQTQKDDLRKIDEALK